ncbi:MAG TPA: diacylglycerol kinase family protein [Gemmatimonadales bacterium]
MTRAVVISNPHASRASRGLQHALARLRAGGFSLDLVPTEEAGHGAELAQQAIDDGAELVIAHGGDGTLMDIAPALVNTGRPLGIIPAGTGNRLAANLGIPNDPEAAAAIILAARSRPVDVGRMTTASSVRHFAVCGGIGFDAEMMVRTQRHHKRRYGMLAYVTTGIKLAMDMPIANVRVEADGVVFEREAVIVLLANCGMIIPSGRALAPQIRLDDGVQDVIIIDARNFVEAGVMVWRLATGTAAGKPGVTITRGHMVMITAEPVMAAEADGDPQGTTPVTSEMLSGALHVLAPPGW